ncbi:MAG: hypothetical protein IKJ74_01040 [Clostridia bacterium]|nr:hypothetical protein [Clostridia bacterium]
MKYVENIVNDDYLHWKLGSVQIITTPTGSRKTSFVLTKLLENAYEKNKFLVYFCNRRTLSKQIKNHIENEIFFPGKYKRNLLICTYQYAESVKVFPAFKEPESEIRRPKQQKFLEQRYGYNTDFRVCKKDILYYVFDEAHYFVSDSSFNKNTSYWKRSDFRQKDSISVFISSTPQPLYLYLGLSKEVMQKIFIKASIQRQLIRNKKNELEKPKSTQALELIERITDSQHILGLPSRSFFDRRLYPSQVAPDTMLPLLQFYTEKEKRINLSKLDHPLSFAIEWMNCVLENQKSSSTFFEYSDNIYTDAPNYGYINVRYFEQYVELNGIIKESTRKWLIFVDSEKEGQELDVALKQQGVDSVFVSAKRKNVGFPEAKKVLEEIATTQSFSDKVLISTSVLDNGVSLNAEKDFNLVISQTDRTAFIQMIGRLRVAHNARINLYLRNFSAKKINSLRAKYENLFFLMMEFYLAQTNNLNIEQRNRIEQKLLNIRPFDILRLKDNKDSTMGSIFSKCQINENFLIHCLYSLANLYESLYPKGDPASHVKNQLYWIGKEYSPENWVNYGESKLALQNLLERYQKKKRLHKDEQDEFCRKVIEVIRLFPKPLLSQSMRSFWKRHLSKKNCGEELLPGKALLNKFFDQQNQPYRIVSKQWYKDRKTVWVIKRKEDQD